jgi:hypothetical protein
MITGSYTLEILLNGLNVPTYLTNNITVLPKMETAPATTRFTGVQQ